MTSANARHDRNPLQAFAETVARRGEAIALVQPIGGGKCRQYSWREVDDEARRMAAYLQGLGLPPQSQIALMSKNCAEWIIADLAIWMAGHVSVPLFATLTAATVHQILAHSDSRLLFVGKLDNWEGARRGVPDELPRIAFGLAPEAARQIMPHWEDIIVSQQPLRQIADRADSDLATIIYTSGTTGAPKGVMHNFAALAAVGSHLIDVYRVTEQDRMISYLPLSHVAERTAVELSFFYVGLTVYFSESLDTFAHDIRRARPTLFFAVPRIWSKFYQKVSERLPPRRLQRLLAVPLLNRLLQHRILAALGLDQCRIAISGAAALAPALIEWYRRIGLEILEAYGMTENLAWSHTTRSGDQLIGWVGTPNEGVECRLGEGNEILVKSIGNMAGYYKEPEMSAQSFVDGHWLKTGDVGEIDASGHLRITGRAKEIFKTEKGKYVAPTPIENRLLADPRIEQACVMGPGLPQPIAVVCPTPEALAQSDDAFIDDIRALHAAVNNSLDAHERLQALVLVRDAWSIDNDLITPTLKLRRNKLEEFYAGELPEWARRSGVFWAGRGR